MLHLFAQANPKQLCMEKRERARGRQSAGRDFRGMKEMKRDEVGEEGKAYWGRRRAGRGTTLEECKSKEWCAPWSLTLLGLFLHLQENNLIYIPAHARPLTTASGGSLISRNWQDGFFKTCLWCEGLTLFFFRSNYIIGRQDMSGVKRARVSSLKWRKTINVHWETSVNLC